MFTSKLKVEECSSSTSNSVSNLLILRNQNHKGYKGHQHICFGLKSEQDDDDAQFDTSDSDNNQGVLMAEKHYPSVQEFASAIPNHLLLGSLLEHLCRIYGGDPTLSNMLFKAIGQRLVSMKLLSPLAISDDFSSVRLQHNQAFTELLHAASTSLFPQGQHILNTDTQGLPARPIEGLFQWQTSRYVSEFEEISRLGKGAYGKVFKVVHKLDGQCHAVKKILIKNVSKEDCKKVLREVKMLSDLQHDSIVGYRTAWMEHVQPTACSHSLLPALESPSTQYSADESLDRSSTGSSILFQSGSRSEPAAAISSMVPPGETCTVQALLPSPEKGQVVCPKLMQHIPENYVPCVFLGQQGSVKNTPCPALSWDSSALAEEGSGREELEPNNKRPCADVASQQQWADTQVATPSKEVQFHLMLYIQMQLCERSLKDWLWERNARSAEEPSSKCPYACVDAEHTLGLLRKTLEGVEYIHSMGIMHRDLKPRNIFLCGQDCQVRIGDFGLACKDITMNDHETLPSTFSNNDCAHTKGVGTFVYAAPEQLEGSHYDSKSDMYSIGVLILELFQPFGTEMERVQVLVNLREGKVPDSFCHRWPILAKYVTQLTSKDPDVRPSSTQLLRSELFNSKDMVIHGLQQRVEEQEEEIIQLRRRISQLQSSQNLAHISDVT